MTDKRSRRYLLALWEGGGNIPPELGVARRLIARGHQVHVLGDPTIKGAAEADGCSFSPWRRGPHRNIARSVRGPSQGLGDQKPTGHVAAST